MDFKFVALVLVVCTLSGVKLDQATLTEAQLQELYKDIFNITDFTSEYPTNQPNPPVNPTEINQPYTPPQTYPPTNQPTYPQTPTYPNTQPTEPAPTYFPSTDSTNVITPSDSVIDLHVAPEVFTKFSLISMFVM